MAGLFHLVPPKPVLPKEIWDVNVVLSFLDRLPPNKDLPLLLLSQKLVILILISTMKRKSELLGMHLDYMVFRPNEVLFTNVFIPKAWSYKSQNPNFRIISLKTFDSNPQICPVKALNEYIHRTAAVRQSRFLFITTQRTFHRLSSMSLRRWILQILVRADININAYGARTTRHASSSKAYYAGVTVDNIMKRAGWSTVTSFIMHYNLPIRQQETYKATRPPGSSIRTLIKKTTQYYSPPLSTPRTRTVSRAAQLISSARKYQVKSAAQFIDSAFVDAPKPVPRTSLKKPVKVVLPAKKSPGILKRMGKAYPRKIVMFSDNVSDVQGVDRQDDEASTDPAEDV